MRKSFIFVQFIFLIVASSFLFASFEALQHSTITTLGSSSRFYFSDSSSDVAQQPNRLEGNFTLNSDLELNYDLEIGPNTVLTLNNHKIIGNGHSIILDSDFTVTSGETLYLSGNVTIEGRKGGNLFLGNRSQILVDGNYTVTLRNLVLKNMFNTIARPAAKCMEWNSKLALDNVTLDLTDDFYFYSGQLFIHNDVVFTGTSQFVYWGVRPSYINSTLYFDQGTTFDYRPSTTDRDLIRMQNEASSIYFDGCTVKTTHTGMQLTKGRVYFDNKVTVTTAAEQEFRRLGDQIIQSYGNYVQSVSWSPDGRFLAVGGYLPTSGNEIQVYLFNGSSLSLVDSKNYGTVIESVAWSPDGRFLAVGGQGPDVGTAEIEVYSFNGLSLNLVVSRDYGSSAYSISWSPDGRFLAVGGDIPTSGNEIQVYLFNGSSLSLVASNDYGSDVYSVSWSPDGRFLAVGGYLPTSTYEIQVYSFNGSSLSLVDSKNYETKVYSVAWSPDGRFLAVGGNTSNNELQVYIFNGTSLSLVVSEDTTAPILSVEWSPDGGFLVASGEAIEDGEIQIYSFDGSDLRYVGYKDYGTAIFSVSWSPDGRFLAAGGEGPEAEHDEIEVYPINFGFLEPRQASTNSIVFSDVQNEVELEASIFVLSGARVILDGIIHL